MHRKITRSNMSVIGPLKRKNPCGPEQITRIQWIQRKPCGPCQIRAGSNEDHVKRLLLHQRKLPIYDKPNEDHVLKVGPTPPPEQIQGKWRGSDPTLFYLNNLWKIAIFESYFRNSFFKSLPLKIGVFASQFGSVLCST